MLDVSNGAGGTPSSAPRGQAPLDTFQPADEPTAPGVLVRELDEPCHHCGKPAVRTIVRYAYCTGCADTILAPIRARVASYPPIHVTPTPANQPALGYGQATGPAPDGWPSHFFALNCTVCDAGWVGLEAEECGYCHLQAERDAAHERDTRLEAKREKRRLPGWLRCSRCGTHMRQTGDVLAFCSHAAHDQQHSTCPGRMQPVYR